MIKKMMFEMLVCDNCKEEYCDDDGVGYFPEGEAEYSAQHYNGWVKFGDSNYCRKCADKLEIPRSDDDE